MSMLNMKVKMIIVKRMVMMMKLMQLLKRIKMIMALMGGVDKPSTSSLNFLLVKRTPAQNPSKLYLENLKILALLKT